MSTYEAIKYNITGANITGIPTSAVTSGTFADARLSASSVTQHVDLTSLSASNLTSGTIPNARYGTPTFNGSNLTNIPGGISDVDFAAGTFNQTTTNGSNEVTANTTIGTSPSWAKAGMVCISGVGQDNMDYCGIKSFSGSGVSSSTKSWSQGHNDWREIQRIRFSDTGFFECPGSTSVTMTVAFRKTIYGGDTSSPVANPTWVCMWIG